MTHKIVSQLDDAGYFVGAAVADQSPLEPGVFLIPGGCVDVAPPAVQSGTRARWVMGGWQFESDATEPDTEPAPETIEQWRSRAVVSRFQARAALHEAGKLAEVEALMSADTTPVLARLAWQDAQEFRRTSPTVVSMGEALGLAPEDLDALFRAASLIEA